MKRNKVGSIFLVSMLALAGLGASYAGFSDLITVYGEVDTGTVDLELYDDFSGTWVYKELATGAVIVTDIPWQYGTYENPLPGYLLVAHSQAMYGSTTDVYMEWNNIFPCIDFEANFVVHYAGSIPAHLSIEDFCFTGFDFTDYMFWHYYYLDDAGNWIEFTTFPIQVHNCDQIKIVLVIHIPQDNTLQGLSGTFGFNVYAIQWYDPCPP